MSLLEHAELEFKASWGENTDDEMQEMVKDNLRELLQVFSEQGHSGFSANYVLSCFQKLANFEPLSPLTGESWEWVEVSDAMYQNARDGRVFKENGQAYFIEGRVFREADGSCFTNSESRVPIESFPYTPVTEYVDR